MIYRMNNATKVATVGGGVSGSDLDNVKIQAVNEAKQYTDTQVSKKASTDQPMAYDYPVHCERYGDIVCLTMNSNAGNSTVIQSGTSVESLPVGYRPATAVSTLCRYGTKPSTVNDMFIDNVGFLTVNTDGTISWGLSNEPTSVQRWTWSISYITNDAFPD